jgi:hypothetical protein
MNVTALDTPQSHQLHDLALLLHVAKVYWTTLSVSHFNDA